MLFVVNSQMLRAQNEGGTLPEDSVQTVRRMRKMPVRKDSVQTVPARRKMRYDEQNDKKEKRKKDTDVSLVDTLQQELPVVEEVFADSVNLTDSLMALHIEPKIPVRMHTPDPIRSMWMALVFPGGGQINNRKFWKLPIFYGGFLGCTYALTWNNQMLHDYQQAYLDIMDSDPNTKSYEKMLPLGYDITGKEERFKNIFKNKKNYFRKYRDMSIFAFAGVYLLSVIDAYVDAELSNFDVTPDLSLHLAPSTIQVDYSGPNRSRTIPAVSLQMAF